MKEKSKNTPRQPASLLTVMGGAFLAITISSILLVGGFQLFVYVRSQQKIIAAHQTLIANDAAASVANFIGQKIERIQTVMGVNDPTEMSNELQKGLLYSVLGMEPSLQNLVLLNHQGERISSVSRLSSPLAEVYLGSLNTTPFFERQEKTTLIGSIYVNPDSNEPMVTGYVPVTDLLGEFKGLLVAEINLTFIWDLVARLKVGRTGQTYVVDRRGLLIAAYDTSRVIRGESGTHIDKVKAYIRDPLSPGNEKTTTYKGISGAWVTGTCIPLDMPKWAVITEMTVLEAYGAVIRSVIISLGFLLSVALLAVGSGLFVARKIAVPILNLTNTASQIAAGEIGLEAQHEGPLEIVKLADAFNNMKDKLTEMLNREENRALQLRAEILSRQEAEKELKAFAQRLSLHVEQTPLGVIELDKRLRVTNWNDSAKKIFNYSREEAVGQRISHLIAPAHMHAQVEHTWNELIRGSGGTRSTTENITRDGKTIFCDWYNTTLFDHTGHVIGVASLVQDITDRKKSEEELRRHRDHLERLVRQRTLELEKEKEIAEAANLAKSEFLASMSHELRTPLNAVLGFSEILKSQEKSGGKLRQLEIIHSSGNMLLSLINDILDLSKIEAGKLELNYFATSIPALAHDLSLLFVEQASHKGVTLNIECNPDIPKALILDETRLRQVCVNLLANAVKFTDEGHIILRIETAPYDNPTRSTIDLIISVEDTGRGIERADIQKIFSPFEQVKSKDAAYKTGTGLGLAITERLVEMMGGRISVESEPGNGSCFTVFLKDVEIAAASQTGDATTFLDLQNLVFEPATVLIVDDIDYNRELLGTFLQDYGFTFVYAANGKEALEQVDACAPDLILMDMKMPVMDGHEASQRIKSGGNSQHIPIIAVTANALKSDVSKILETCDAYLAKPVQKIVLIQEMEKFLPHTHTTSTSHYSSDDFMIQAPWDGIESDVAQLPQDLVNTLVQASILCEHDQVYAASRQLETYNSKVAALLRRYADEFNFDKILEILDSHSTS